MIEIKSKEKCCGCNACFNICPKKAIEMVEDERGFKYPIINKKLCIDCRLCEKACPIINKLKCKNIPIAYAAINKNEEVRLKSSSGGVFSLMAEFILNNNGVVFGAAFNSDFMVEHIRITTKEELDKLRGAKYVQSNIGNTYSIVKRELELGEKVLFTGTPCQVSGLMSYLGKEYKNLYTQDIICHGVPSTKVWKKYLGYMAEQNIKPIVDISFRNKDSGWNEYSLLMNYDNGEYKVNHNKDVYMKTFLKNYSLRDSCYKCNFKDKNRKSDITLADFWGIRNVLPEMDDNKGTSLVIVNSDKGRELLENIKSNLIIKETELEQSIKSNKSMIESANLPRGRDDFFENLEKSSFEDLVNKYVKDNKISFMNKCIKKIKRKLK